MSRVFEYIIKSLNEQQIEYVSAVKIEHCDVISQRKLPQNAKSVCVFLIPYYSGKHENRNVSLYSVPRDYHLFVKQLGEKLLPELKREFPDESFDIFSDDSPLDEVKLAVTGSLGVLGCNRLVINKKYGSFVFVASIITSAVFDKEEYVQGKISGCLNCGKCKDACDFLNGKSDRCFSEVTQSKKLGDNELDSIINSKIKWGCDKCQLVCPMNKDVSVTPIEFFKENLVANVTKEKVSGMSQNEFEERAYSWRGKEVICRNLGEE